MNKKINFKKWDEGKAIYWICDVYLPINVKKQIIKFNWEDVSDEDAIKIKTKQAQIFHEECSRIVALWKDVFKSNLSQFNNKKKYIKNEMSDMRSILAIDENLNVVYYEKSFLNHKQLVFEKDSVNQVRHYFHDVILLDKIRTFDFIHSNNFKYQHLSKTPSEIYAQVCWNFYNWLQKINLEIEQRELFVKPDIEKIEPKITVEKKKIYSLISLFDGNKKKVGLIKKALNKLNITKDSS